MKKKLSWLCASAFVALMASPAMAQAPINPAEIADFNNFLNSNPRVARELTANPYLVGDKNYLASRPDLHSYLAKRKHLRQALQTSPGQFMYQEGRYGWNYGAPLGAYDDSHRWRNADWWHQNNPNWMWQNHPEWAKNNPTWRNDGDFDDRHQWHSQGWWKTNQPTWAQQHHPNWYGKEERQEHRHGHDHDRH
jgi:hypothetical protein